jgi:hypothetical protein
MRTILATVLLLMMAAISTPAVAQNAAETNVTTNEAAPPADPSANEAAPANDQQPADEADEPGQAAPEVNDDDDPRVLPESGQVIVKLFVLAVLLESALALLFNWRPFVASLDGRAVKPLASFIAALVVVFAFQLHTVTDLLDTYGGEAMSRDGLFVSRIIEAMIIAGGSHGVNTMLRSLGFRAIPTAETEQKPPPTEAWLSVGLHRKEAVGPVQVEAVPGGHLGTIHGTMRKAGLASFFLRDKGRLPQSGGKSVTPDTEIAVTVTGLGKDGRALTSSPQNVKLAPGALIDLEFTL